jgi:hypothetical protein
MQSSLQIEDFIYFEDLVNKLSNDINSKGVRKTLTNDDLVKAL